MNLNLWKTRKKELNLNYAGIANIANVSKRTVEDIFRGYNTNPRIDTVQAIERALGLNTITKEERAAGIVDTDMVAITADEDELLTLYRELREKRGITATQAVKTVISNML